MDGWMEWNEKSKLHMELIGHLLYKGEASYKKFMMFSGNTNIICLLFLAWAYSINGL